MKTLFRKLIFLLYALISFTIVTAQQFSPVDKQATKETKALFRNLKRLSKNHTRFGHQHATEYGHGWAGEADRSDVKSVTGSHPAVIGIDVMGFSGRPAEAINQSKAQLKKIVEDTYNRGGVTTIAWHF